MDRFNQLNDQVQVKVDLGKRHCTQSFALSILPFTALAETIKSLDHKCSSCIYEPANDAPSLMKNCTAQCCPSNSSECLFKVVDLVERHGLQGMSRAHYVAFKALVTENDSIAESYDAWTVEGALMA
jgi:hypothetical protein